MIIQKILNNKLIEFFLDLIDKFKNWRKGYGFIPTSYYSDPKWAIARKVLPILECYRMLVVRGDNMSLPQWVLGEMDRKDLTHSQLNEIWLENIDKMILAFKLILDDKWEYGYEIKIDEGILLFAKHYQNLWD